MVNRLGRYRYIWPSILTVGQTIPSAKRPNHTTTPNVLLAMSSTRPVFVVAGIGNATGESDKRITIEEVLIIYEQERVQAQREPPSCPQMFELSTD